MSALFELDYRKSNHYSRFCVNVYFSLIKFEYQSISLIAYDGKVPPIYLLPCNDKNQYMVALQVTRYCILA